MKTLLKLSLAATAVITAFGAQAQEFPSKDKTVTLVVPYAAGGPTDRVARDLAEALRKPLGVSVVVDNAAGAGSTIGTAKAARATPDGYTLLLNHISMSTMPTMYRKLAFNVVNDFEYLGIINDVPMTLIAKPSMAANNYKELSTWINQNKGKINLGNAGQGSASHLCGLMFQSALQIDMTPVPYKGTAPAITDLIGGQIDLLCDQTTNTTSQIKSGKIKPYAVTTKTRVPSLPDIPTTAEAGLGAFEVAVWHGLYAPKGTPKPVIDSLSKALQVALKDNNVKQRFAELGTEPVAENRATPEAHRAFLKSEIDKWSPIIKKAGVYAD